MKIVTNTKLINRNSKIGQYTSTAALVVLGIGLFISFKYQNLFVYSVVALLVGFFLSQVGMYFSNRWGRSPRSDELIDKSLKGMGREYTIYHFSTPVSHLLLGPAGLWTIMPYYLSGSVVYEKKRWRAKGGGFIQGYLRLFGQENIGRPDLESEAEIDTAKRYLQRTLPEGTEIPPIRTALLFAHPKVDLQAKDAPLPVLTPKDIREFLKEEARLNPLPPETLAVLRKALPKADNASEN